MPYFKDNYLLIRLGIYHIFWWHLLNCFVESDGQFYPDTPHKISFSDYWLVCEASFHLVTASFRRRFMDGS